MFRSITALVALTLLMAAGPAQRQPTASSVPSTTKDNDAAAAEQKSQAIQEKNQKASEVQDKAWDKKMKSTLGSVCQGC